ncbi:MAG: dTMP kinase [bacterium]|nr:dTMP kinase [bacterium]
MDEIYTMTKGKLITFEGIEGCGKSTQAKLLYEYLRERGVDVVLSREPGGTELGEKVRDILLNSPEGVVSSGAELFLFIAARVQLIEDVVLPALEAGQTVILDRYVHSTLAYQGYGNYLGLEPDEIAGRIDGIRQVCYESAFGIWPDIVFLIDIPVEVGLNRIAGRRPDGIESRDKEFHNGVRDGFLALAETEPDIFEVVDGTGEIEEISESIKDVLEKKS